MAETRHFDEYVDAFERVGEESFVRKFRWHVLIGLEIVGVLDEAGARGEQHTFLSAVHADDDGVALNRRVWPIRKSVWGPDGPAVRVGRVTDGNDIALPDYSVSKKHFEFIQEHGRIYVVDVGAHNGVRVNDTLVPAHERHILRDEDELIVGRIRLEYLSNGTFIERLRNTAKMYRRMRA
jgi:hypothetical protein